MNGLVTNAYRSRTWVQGIGGVVLIATSVLHAGPTEQGTASQPGPVSQPASAPASQEDFERIYQERLGSVQDNDAEGLYGLATWCAGKGRSDLAAELCQQILGTWPSHEKAKRLLRLATRRMAALQGPVSRPAPAAARPDPIIVLSDQAIHRLRFWEFRPDDMADRPRVRISRQVINEFLDGMAQSGTMTPLQRRDFLRHANDDKLAEMVKHTGDRYIGRIKMASDPRVFMTFRQRVWPIVGRGCATSACHDRSYPGPFRLLTAGSAYTPIVYANFYATDSFESDQGRLIDRGNPEASLLLQYGLPSEMADKPHPVPVKAAFLSRTHPRYRIVLDWIRSLRSPRPSYGITEKMTRPLVTVSPATQPRP